MWRDTKKYQSWNGPFYGEKEGKLIKKMEHINTKHLIKETNEEHKQDEYMEGNASPNKTQRVSDDKK